MRFLQIVVQPEQVSGWKEKLRNLKNYRLFHDEVELVALGAKVFAGFVHAVTFNAGEVIVR